jgi:steroid delta-isomerase-like uncharacterized protein
LRWSPRRPEIGALFQALVPEIARIAADGRGFVAIPARRRERTQARGAGMTTRTGTPTAREAALASFEGARARDPERLVAPGHPDDYVDDIVAIGEFRGKEAVRGFFDELFAAIPDFELSIERTVAEGDAVAVKWRATGTFRGGRFQGIEPTGKAVEIRGVDFFEVEDGLIRRNTVFYDGASFARQIGLLPRADSLADRALLRLFNLKTRLLRSFRRRR